jgi:hypothetical protein
LLGLASWWLRSATAYPWRPAEACTKGQKAPEKQRVHRTPNALNNRD